MVTCIHHTLLLTLFFLLCRSIPIADVQDATTVVNQDLVITPTLSRQSLSYFQHPASTMTVPRSLPSHHPIIAKWLSSMQNASETQAADHPSYYVHDPGSLITTSKPTSFAVATGNALFGAFLPRPEEVRHELILVTCFWASSHSQLQIAALLRGISDSVVREGRERVRVRLGFSSFSVGQKVGHTGSKEGRVWREDEWGKLGLPGKEELRGLEMKVKSVFFKPVSVMHPKFVVVDRRKVWLPSCNVSWEEWFEGVVGLEGEIVGRMLDFWKSVWGVGEEILPPLPAMSADISSVDEDVRIRIPLLGHTPFQRNEGTTTILLPSPHHASFGTLLKNVFWMEAPPPTPLNLFLTTSFESAAKSISITTPNLTCKAVINSLFEALQRGIDVTVITSRKLMILEQLATARTITEFEIWKLQRRYRTLLKNSSYNKMNSDVEMGRGQVGILKIGYFRGRGGDGEPVKLHFKSTVVDEEVVVLGSGNMDTASWYTSQELGVAMFGREVVGEIRGVVEEGLEGRVEWVL